MMHRSIHTEQSIAEMWTKESARLVRISPSLERWIQQWQPLKLYNTDWWRENLDCGNESPMSWSVINQALVRDMFTQNFSWSIPSQEAITKIVNFVSDKPLTEYMAGTGYWAYFLKAAGVDITATDGYAKSFQVGKRPTFVPIGKANVRNVQIGNDPIMLQWVPYGSNDALSIMLKMKPGQKLIWVGESVGGCTANYTTYDFLDDHFDLVEEVDLVQFFGLHDQMQLFRRKQ